MYLFHGLVSDKYRLWFRLHGLTDQVEFDVDFENYEDWHKEIMQIFNLIAGFPDFYLWQHFHVLLKFQFIQTTSDDINCLQTLKLNETVIWENQLTCPTKYEAENNIYMCGDDSRVLNGKIRNFKFFTHDI